MWMRDLIFWASTKKAVTRRIADSGMRTGFARRFIAGESLAEALTASEALMRESRKVSLNHLGENVATPEEAQHSRDSYVEMVRELARRKIDGNISIKLTQLGLDLGRDLCFQLADEIVTAASALRYSIEIDMEGSSYTDATIEIFEQLRQKHDNVGLAIQAYLHRTEKDLARLAPLSPKIRLVKGAYREPPEIAVQGKALVDANYLKLIDVLLHGPFFPAIATHDPAMLDYAMQVLPKRAYGTDRYEFQMIYGIRRDLQQRVRDQGHPLRVYVPFGTEWCPYFMRRLAERPANCGFVIRSLVAESFRPAKSLAE